MTSALSDRRLGILVALLGMLMFALNDVMGKWLVSTYSVGQVLLLRSAAALIVLAPILWRGRTRLWPLERPKLQALRVLACTFEVFAFYYAVISLPLADVMTYWLAGPIYVAALSPWLLGERVGPWRWGAIVAGFVGVVIALRPGAEALTPAVIVSLLGSFAFAFMILSARLLRGTPDGALVFWQTAGAGAAGVLTAGSGWVTPSAFDFGLLSLLGVVAMFAHMLIARALKLADASAIAPMEYTLLLWAIVFGWLIFGDVPDRAILLGGALITVAGLVIWVRESRARRPRAASRRQTLGTALDFGSQHVSRESDHPAGGRPRRLASLRRCRMVAATAKPSATERSAAGATRVVSADALVRALPRDLHVVHVTIFSSIPLVLRGAVSILLLLISPSRRSKEQ